MLERLHIKNIAVIDEVEIEFSNGFHVLTGETGAGKSILIDSINMVLGERTSRELIRGGEQKASVEALFQVSSRAREQLAVLELELEEDELLITREITTEGKSVSKLNGSLVTTAMVKEVAKILINIHGQHDNQALLTPHKHGDLLDHYAGLIPLREEYAQCYLRGNRLRQEIESLDTNEAEKERKLDLLQYQIDEITGAELTIGEDEELVDRRNLLSSAEGIVKTLSGAEQVLYLGENGPSLYDSVSQVVREISGYTGLDPTLEEIYNRLESTMIELDDIIHQMKDFGEGFEFDPAEQNRIEERLDLINKLKRKYGPTIEAVLEECDQMQQELEGITLSEVRSGELKQALKKVEVQRQKLADQLSERRRQSGRELEQKIMRELADLDMGKVKFSVSILPAEFSASGADKIEFLIATNPGEPLKPLTKIASGGELSRIMLAIKSIVADSDYVGTMIFDEIDTGVSGRAAQKIAEKINKISKNKQIICITHLAQIAAMADHHYLIEKQTTEQSVQTRVYLLEEQKRELELARIIGGTQITDLTLQNVREMRKLAKEYKEHGTNG